MDTEFEATFVETDHETLRSKLKTAGAALLSGGYLMRRTIFDYPDLRLDKKAAWVRLRQENECVMLSYKQRLGETIEGMKEIEVEVSDFDKTAELLQVIGLTVKAQQESKREIWKLGRCEIMLDTWPWIPPFIEIEGPSKNGVKDTAQSLGLNWDQALFDSIDGVYMRYYDVSRTEISTCKIAFGAIPTWLKARRKQTA